jgi:hypothetical protein
VNYSIICHNTNCKHWHEFNKFQSDEKKQLTVEYCGRLHCCSELVLGANGECIHSENKLGKDKYITKWI